MASPAGMNEAESIHSMRPERDERAGPQRGVERDGRRARPHATPSRLKRRWISIAARITTNSTKATAAA